MRLIPMALSTALCWMCGLAAVSGSTGGSASALSAPEDKGKGLFFMYDLPEKYWWRFPDARVNCSKSAGYLPGDAHHYSGIGDPVDFDRGIFNTWHFSMFNSLFNRLKRSSRRTRDPDEAAFFVVPYDMALDGFIRQSDCAQPRYPQCTPALVSGVTNTLTASAHFQRYQGADHVLMWSLGELHPWPGSCNMLMKRFCANCTLTSYWTLFRNRGKNFISLPFPSSFHYHDQLKAVPWTPRQHRPIFAVYAGSIQTLNPDHTKVRRAVVEQCQAHAKCTHLDLQHTSVDSNVLTAVSTYAKSVFCLCPAGDDPSRKALFDILMMGCIPVLTHAASLHNQHPYHMTESIAKEISVYIPGANIRLKQTNIFNDVLLKISPNIIAMKQQAIARIASTLQYSVPPVELLQNRSDETVWDSPVRDAVDVFIDAMVRRSSLRRRGEFYGEPELTTHAFTVPDGRTWNNLYKSILT